MLIDLNTESSIKTTLLSLRQWRKNFEKKCCKDPIPWTKNSIGNIEGFYYWSLVHYLKPGLVMESGIKNGRSTKILARACESVGCKHYAFDVAPWSPDVDTFIRDYPNSACIMGSSVNWFTEISSKFPRSSVLCFLDGPKASITYRALVENCSKLPLIGLVSHDCYPKGKPREAFEYCARKFLQAFDITIPAPPFNDDLLYLNDYIMQDAETIEPGRGQALNTSGQYIGICIKK